MKNNSQEISTTVLCSAYAVNPYHGSEDGMGWNFIMQIARFNKVIAVTRENTKRDIEAFMRDHPSESYNNITFVYYDLPYWMRFWKKGGRGALLYFYMWQFFLPRHVKRQKLEFDITHNINFHNDWTPSRLWRLNKPFIWGPIGHHSKIPKDYIIHVYGYKSYLLEQLKWAVKKYFWKVDPILRSTVQNANVILTMNSSVEKVLSLEKEQVYYMTSVSSEMPTSKDTSKPTNAFTVLSAGRFVPLKGFDITIKSFARFYSHLPVNDQKYAKLILVGDGPYKSYLVQLAKDLKISHAVEFVDWIERKELQSLYASSKVFLFPSHEGAGMVVSEALSHGLPILCFKNDGPGEFVDLSCSITIPYSRYNSSITSFAEALNKLYTNPALCQQLSQGAKERFKEQFDWNRKGEKLRELYKDVLRKAG
jgi:glycosyltransferase involved in cell wall biosynthesis